MKTRTSRFWNLLLIAALATMTLHAHMIVGNKKYVDTKALAKYGKVVEMKVRDLFSKDEE
ncbi:MAG: hypothetical protein LBT49_01590 [Prevotellaceae bacterium]|jgi:hypothetical protein|nr:hypothetical protein [Prevotellaceae bacterium]